MGQNLDQFEARWEGLCVGHWFFGWAWVANLTKPLILSALGEREQDNTAHLPQTVTLRKRERYSSTSSYIAAYSQSDLW